MRRTLWVPALLAVALAGCRDDGITAVRAGGPLLTQVSAAPVVNSLDDTDDFSCDDTHCSLREAIAFADAGGTITFATGLTGTITLTSYLVLDKNLTITGPGAASLSVNGNNTATSVFIVYAEDTVSISGLTMTGGTGSSGAGVDNAGVLTLTECVVTGNDSQDRNGGGIINSGTLTISQSTISNNNSNRDGGGIYNDSGVVTITGSTVSGNQATNGGGGIYNHRGTLVITETTISGNSADDGGGLRSLQGPATLIRSTIVSNSANYGGGMSADTWLIGGPATYTTILNSTISGNTAAYDGGGIINDDGEMRILFSTITGNQTGALGGSGGGLFTQWHVTVKGSVIWGNTLTTGGAANDVEANQDNVIISLGYNLIGAAGSGIDFTHDFTATGDATNVSNAVLGALADNGGPTLTHALLAGSPAINTSACTDHDGAAVTTDQRGVTRPQGAGCDKGAYEFEETSGLPAPNFTFVLPSLTKTYGDPSFSVASYAASSNSSGTITFLTGVTSVGCSVSLAGAVTLTGAAVDPSACLIEARIASDGTYSSAGPITQSFHIGKAALTVTANDVTIAYGATPSFGVSYGGFVGSDSEGALGGTLAYTFEGTGATTYGPAPTPPTGTGTYSITPSGYTSANYNFSYVAGAFTINKAAGSVSINNLPVSSHPVVGGSFTPTYTKSGDGAASTSSRTTGVCTESGGVVSFIAVGTCTLEASVAEGTDYLAATGPTQSFTVFPAFSSTCGYTINPKNGQRNLTVTWANAWPSVTQIQVSTTRTVQKAMAPTESGSWSTKVPAGTPTYGIYGGTARRDISTVLVAAGTACTLSPP